MMHTTSTRIKRDKSLPKNRQEERLRFFSIAKALYKLHERRFFDKKADLAKDVDKIRQRIYQETVVDWEWLLAKCDELGSPKIENK
ncbi:MAG: hypothetical protein IT260_08680 [Saprospiraceae bacterium]|nr:hypothetical protein [Saprospiraceae bacterium]